MAAVTWPEVKVVQKQQFIATTILHAQHTDVQFQYFSSTPEVVGIYYYHQVFLARWANLVAFATSLDKSENKLQIHHLRIKRVHTVKRLRKSVQYIGDIRWNTPFFGAVSYLTFTNELCQLWSYWTEFHEFFLHDIEESYALLTRTARPWKSLVH